jgi:hypothetical protein
MALNQFTNNASTTLASSINSSVTSLTVAAGTGALFPTLAGSNYFYTTISNVAGTLREIVKVTARSTDTFTIVRGQDNTTAQSWTTGDTVELRVTAADLENFPQLDSTNTFAQIQTFTSGVSLGVDLPVAEGGTGASTADTARNNLVAARSGSNTDITSLSGLTTPLSAGQGGTGANSLVNAGIDLVTFTSTPTAAATTTLLSTSNSVQFFTGTTTQTIVLPVASTMVLGQRFTIHNNSTDALTVNSSGANLVGTVQPNITVVITCISTSGTSAASWDYDITGFTTALPTTRGGTNLTSFTSGGALYATSTSALTTGTLPIASGGTNSTATPTAGAVPYGTGTSLSYTSVGTAGQVLQSNGSSAPTWGTAGGGLNNVTSFTSSTTWTVPAGITKVWARLCGGGGGRTSYYGNAGGGGGYCEGIITTTPGASMTVTIGAGGGTNVSGGTSSFGGMTASGGSYATYYNATPGGAATGGSWRNFAGGSSVPSADTGGGCGGNSSWLLIPNFNPQAGWNCGSLSWQTGNQGMFGGMGSNYVGTYNDASGYGCGGTYTAGPGYLELVY